MQSTVIRGNHWIFLKWGGGKIILVLIFFFEHQIFFAIIGTALFFFLCIKTKQNKKVYISIDSELEMDMKLIKNLYL